MADGQTNYWGQHDLSRERFGSTDMERNLTELRRQQTATEFSCNISHSALYSDSCCLASDSSLRLHEGDQVVPSVQRRWVFGGHQREAKPLPPLPDPEELMSDEAADSEVEFFTSDRRRLLPKSCPKAMCRGPNRNCGQVNQAYQEGSWRAGTRSMALSWPSQEDRPAVRGSGFWALDQDQDSRFFCSGPDKPLIPPRVPIPPKPPKDREDKPPKIPPRVPLVPPCPPRTPSPKSLPIYINGVMPATQSFAANPQYVSKASQRQQSERAPPAAQFSPCIVPILKDGRQASATHYILLPPGRPAFSSVRERPLSEPARTGSNVWQNR